METLNLKNLQLKEAELRYLAKFPIKVVVKYFLEKWGDTDLTTEEKKLFEKKLFDGLKKYKMSEKTIT